MGSDRDDLLGWLEVHLRRPAAGALARGAPGPGGLVLHHRPDGTPDWAATVAQPGLDRGRTRRALFARLEAALQPATGLLAGFLGAGGPDPRLADDLWRLHRTWAPRVATLRVWLRPDSVAAWWEPVSGAGRSASEQPAPLLSALARLDPAAAQAACAGDAALADLAAHAAEGHEVAARRAFANNLLPLASVLSVAAGARPGAGAPRPEAPGDTPVSEVWRAAFSADPPPAVVVLHVAEELWRRPWELLLRPGPGQHWLARPTRDAPAVVVERRRLEGAAAPPPPATEPVVRVLACDAGTDAAAAGEGFEAGLRAAAGWCAAHQDPPEDWIPAPVPIADGRALRAALAEPVDWLLLAAHGWPDQLRVGSGERMVVRELTDLLRVSVRRGVVLAMCSSAGAPPVAAGATSDHTDDLVERLIEAGVPQVLGAWAPLRLDAACRAALAALCSMVHGDTGAASAAAVAREAARASLDPHALDLAENPDLLIVFATTPEPP